MNELYTWDFTLSEKYCQNENLLKEILCKYCKKYAFQLEKGGTTGFLHWQGRVSLIKKKRMNALIQVFKDSVLGNGHLSPTSNPAKGDTFYVMKEDTRVKGPWSDKDEIIYIPRQIKEMKELRPFQQHIVDNASVWDKRTINMIYCKFGNIGKSLLVGYCRAHKVGRALPPVNDNKDLLRMVCNLPTSRMYLFDMPRAMNKDRLYSFYSAVETIKDGYAYDDRYKFEEKVFDCPNIWIFSNNLPDFNMLSKDRWRIWSIKPDSFELEKYKSLCESDEE